jgi:uncharacterized protein (TIGR04222 family)
MNLSLPTPALPDAEAWARLCRWRPEQAAQRRHLVARVQARCGGTRDEALRLVEEYRRFLRILLARGGQACPSDAIDEIWHEHILDTREYFERFCPQILGRVIHHCPSEGGPAETARHRANYQATLAEYQRLFGSPPPADLWPAVEERFSERFVRVSRRAHWVLRKPSRWHGLGFGAALVASGCATITVNPGMSGPEFLKTYLLAWLAMAIVGWLLVKTGHGSGQGQALAGRLQPVELGYLAGGAPRAISTALAGLYQSGNAKPAGERWEARRPPPDGTHALLRATYRELKAGRGTDQLPALLGTRTQEIHQRLHAQGLLTAASATERVLRVQDKVYYGAALALLAWGAARIWHGVQHHYPVGFLTAICLVAAIGLLIFYFKAYPPKTTREARRTLREVGSSLTGRQRGGYGLADPMMLTALAVLGVGALSATELGALTQALSPLQPRDNGNGSSDSGSSSDSGCSGSDGGGGGCGGCGGGGD